MATQRANARGPSEQEVRRWLGLLRQHDRLAEPELEDLLLRAGRLPASGAPLAVGKAAAEYLHELIEELRSSEDAGTKEQLPYLVLKHCFVHGQKSFQVANRLGLSGRQLTRERARAISLLTASINEVSDHVVPASPQRIPVIAEFLARANVSTALTCAIERDHLLRIHGPKGIGKTSLVADFAAAAQAGGTPVLWYRFRLGLNDSLHALLYDIADLLAAFHLPGLTSLLAEHARPASIPVLTRMALRDLGQLPALLLVADDYHIVEHDHALAGFLDELESRHENARIVTIGRHDVSGDHSQYEVPPFTIAETAELLAALNASVTPDLAARIHQWTHGVPHLISMAGSWLQTSTREQIDAGLGSLSRLDEVQDYLLDSITELMGAVDRSILDAASIFRDRFTDEALAHVSGNTRGAVADASRYFVRFHVATRGRDGDVAFFHTSVRDYIYTRLDDARRQQLHRRAADHYERVGSVDEAAYHEQMAELLPDMEATPYPVEPSVAALDG